jgi:diguanylate cyclase (GGDEF)-like protein/PAS domain S-box-containing protein
MGVADLSGSERLAAVAAGPNGGAPPRPRRPGGLSGERLTMLLLGFVCLVAIGAETWNVLQSRAATLRRSYQASINLAYSVALYGESTLNAGFLLANGIADALGDAPGLRGDGVGPEGWRAGAVSDWLRRRLREHAPREPAGAPVIAGAPRLHDVVLLDTQGNAVAHALPGDAATGPAVAGDAARAFADPRPAAAHLGAAVRGPQDGVWSLAVYRRVSGTDGVPLGVLRLEIDLATFDAFFAQLDIGPHGVISIFTRDRIPLVRAPPLPPDMAGRRLPASGNPEVYDRDFATFEATATVDGVRRLYAYRRIAGHDLVLFVGMGKADVLRAWRDDCALTAAAVLCFLAVVLFTGRRLVAQMRARRDAVAAYRMLAENATDMVFRLDAQCVRRYVSPASAEILGYAPEELVGKRPVNMIHPQDAARVAEVYDAVLAGQERASVTNRIRHRSGAWMWVEAELRCIRHPRTGAPDGILGALRDITRRHAAEEAARTSAARYRLLTDYTTDMILHLRPDLTREFISPACRTLLGYAPEDLLDRDYRGLAHADDVAAINAALAALRDDGTMEITYRALHRDGHYVWLEARGRRLPEDKGYVILSRDVSSRHRETEQLARRNRQLAELAMRDGLTGLHNRRHFDATLQTEYARALRTGRALALLMIDADHFKAYNDINGHPAGDACLRRIAEAVSGALRRPADIAARYGGEEFAVLLPETDCTGARLIAERIRAAVAGLALAHAAGACGHMSVSIGVAAHAAQAMPGPGVLLAEADGALYRAKRGGRDRVCVSDETTVAAETAPAG